eukprot:c18546_g3_i1 orf=21-425(-)
MKAITNALLHDFCVLIYNKNYIIWLPITILSFTTLTQKILASFSSSLTKTSTIAAPLAQAHCVYLRTLHQEATGCARVDEGGARRLVMIRVCHQAVDGKRRKARICERDNDDCGGSRCSIICCCSFVSNPLPPR